MVVVVVGLFGVGELADAVAAWLALAHALLALIEPGWVVVVVATKSEPRVEVEERVGQSVALLLLRVGPQHRWRWMVETKSPELPLAFE